VFVFLFLIQLFGYIKPQVCSAVQSQQDL